MTLGPAVDRPPATRPSGGVSPWLVLACVAVGAAAVVATRPIGDPDLFWHLVAGPEILTRHTVSGLGRTWSFAHANDDWVTTQWLSEVLLTGTERLAGFRGILALRLLVTALLAGLLASQLLRAGGPVWGPVVFVLTLLSVAPFLQERPQLFSLPLLVVLASWSGAVLEGRGPPPWLLVGAITWLWANLHGLWVMVPATFALLALCRLLAGDRGASVACVRTVMAGLVAGCLSPVGPALLLSPARFAAATGQISEWQPTAPRDPAALLLDLMILLLVLAWVRTEGRVSWSEVLYGVSLVAFSLLAFRNIAPAAVLLAPVLVRRLDEAFPRHSQADSVRERRLLQGACAVVLPARRCSAPSAWRPSARSTRTSRTGSHARWPRTVARTAS